MKLFVVEFVGCIISWGYVFMEIVGIIFVFKENIFGICFLILFFYKVCVIILYGFKFLVLSNECWLFMMCILIVWFSLINIWVFSVGLIYMSFSLSVGVVCLCLL